MMTGETSLTVESLTALFRPGETIPPLVLLKPGSKSSPIFMTHGIGDTVLGLFRLASRVQSERRIYGLQARGCDGLEEPLDRIEDMAEFHLGAVRQTQPHGPYILIGYSFGGLIALEMARRLSCDGEKIALLAMLDSYPDRRQIPLGQQARLVFRLAMTRASWFRRRRGSKGISQHDESVARAFQRVKDCQYRALRNYRPQFYDGKVNFVRAAISSFFPKNATAVWSHLAREFEIENLPCTHLELLTTQAESLSASLSRLLNALPSEGETTSK
jgi:thioesterase domain-containing protein